MHKEMSISYSVGVADLMDLCTRNIRAEIVY